MLALMRAMTKVRSDRHDLAPSWRSAGAAFGQDHAPARGPGNQARLRGLGAVQAASVNRDDAAQDEVVTVEAADAGAADLAPADAGSAAPAAPAKAALAAGGCTCEVASGPDYKPTGAIPVASSGGRKRAPFDFTAAFTNDPASGKDPGCCHVRQMIKWDSAFATAHGGPPHSGFPAGTAAGDWIEDRDKADTRYGWRAGPHSAPAASCGDEYKTAARRDMAAGDHYCGHDGPNGPDTLTGKWNFQLVVFDTPGNPVARGSVIAVNW
jgi:hypothetical protein